jgi:hypothetical protein
VQLWRFADFGAPSGWGYGMSCFERYPNDEHECEGGHISPSGLWTFLGICGIFSIKGSLAQLVRAGGSYPQGRRFKSYMAHLLVGVALGGIPPR